MANNAPKRFRCAIYTRKSSEEGLEQAFNSLDAQREACEAYVASQVGEGWVLAKSRYDDGGISGGTMERAALQQLLADIQARRIDVVVVYKVDRLTRSLADFAKIVEVFDAHSVSFVSVTQQFNTTTSMGRLTLNMLLSFAQFEREVTGERIRDKIAASKKKGMWMGGFVPLGYESRGRTLVINIREAKTIRTLFELYLRLGSVRLVKQEADRLGLLTKRRPGSDGKMRGGRPLSRGHIYRLLSTPLYAGRIEHKGAVYDGQHTWIVDPNTWDKVQAQLATNANNRRGGLRVNSPGLLVGLLYDGDDHRLTPSHTMKGGKRYRYYVSPERPPDHKRGSSYRSLRVPAQEIEDLVCGQLHKLLGDRGALHKAIDATGLSARDQQRITTRASEILGGWPDLSESDRASFVRAVVQRVAVSDGHIELAMARSGLRNQLSGALPSAVTPDPHNRSDGDVFTISVSAQLRSYSRELRLVFSQQSESSSAPRFNPVLLNALGRAYAWKEQLFSAQPVSPKVIATEEGVSARYVRHLVRLAFVAPEIVDQIVSGLQPPQLELRSLANMPLTWSEQLTALRGR